jgi:hypothetical protein
MHCRFSDTVSVTRIFVYTLLSKLTWHGRAECLSRGPCVQECMDSCCFVLELVGSAEPLRKLTSSV